MTRTLQEIAAHLARLHPNGPRLREVLPLAFQEERSFGAIIAGSYAYGEPGQDSDLDITAISSDGTFARKTFQLGSLTVDCWSRPPNNVVQLLRNVERPGTIDMFARGTIIFDTKGIVSGLQQSARAIVKAGRPVSDGELVGKSSRMRHLSTICDRPSLSEIQRIVIKSMLVDELVELWFVKAREFLPAPLTAIERIEQRDPAFSNLLLQIVHCSIGHVGDTVNGALEGIGLTYRPEQLKFPTQPVDTVTPQTGSVRGLAAYQAQKASKRRA
jgi:hypothetical protein